MTGTGFRAQQVLALLLSAIPFAERMLLYNLAMAALVMLPDRWIRQIN